MPEEYYVHEWVCTQCGGAGDTRLLIGMTMKGAVCEIVRVHSLACGGCDGDATTCLRLRPYDASDEQWELLKMNARAKAATADHTEDWMTEAQWIQWPW